MAKSVISMEALGLDVSKNLVFAHQSNKVFFTLMTRDYHRFDY